MPTVRCVTDLIGDIATDDTVTMHIRYGDHEVCNGSELLPAEACLLTLSNSVSWLVLLLNSPAAVPLRYLICTATWVVSCTFWKWHISVIIRLWRKLTPPSNLMPALIAKFRNGLHTRRADACDGMWIFLNTGFSLGAVSNGAPHGGGGRRHVQSGATPSL